jgi:trimethylamine:corrinoid methyltransferase-like protein
MAGISAPFCYNGVLATTHAEVLFAICTAQLLNPGNICIHGGFPSIADPRFDYNPNYGLLSHNLLNLLMAHLNMMLDLPTIQSGCTTNEEHVTDRALEDARSDGLFLRNTTSICSATVSDFYAGWLIFLLSNLRR